MTPQDRKLLLKDLCGRLPYGVVLDCGSKICGEYLTSINMKPFDGGPLINGDWDIGEVKPCLRPMGSMTEEERERYLFLDANLGRYSTKEDARDLIDFLNAHHFDYRGLIEKGLAIEVTEDNNPYKD